MLYKAFQDTLFQTLNIQQADPVEKEKVLSLFEELANQITLDCILQELSSTNGHTFLTLLEKDDSGEEAMVFAKSNIPDLDTQVSTRLKEEIDQLHSPNQ